MKNECNDIFKLINFDIKMYQSYLQKYFKNELAGKPLTIVGMNDDRGFNIHKNILMVLNDILKSNHYNIELLDMYSMLFNKTRHIDYFLSHNLSLEEIRLMQEYGTANELNHAVGFKIPFIDTASKVFNKLLLTKKTINSDVKTIKISDRIKEAKKPLIIYASGLNDIMYELHINPFNLKKAYMRREIDPRYNYASNKVNEEIVRKVIEGHRKNFETLLSLNETSDIYVLSAYLYSDFNKDYEQKFKDIILMYNDNLSLLCNEYDITYINLRILENTKYNRPISNYISKYPPYIISYEIIKQMYKNSISNNKKDLIIPKFKYNENGCLGVLIDLDDDIKKCELNSMNFTAYEKQIYLEKAEEHRREKQVFQKILMKSHCVNL